jgi:hypothetical protein
VIDIQERWERRKTLGRDRRGKERRITGER